VKGPPKIQAWEPPQRPPHSRSASSLSTCVFGRDQVHPRNTVLSTLSYSDVPDRGLERGIKGFLVLLPRAFPQCSLPFRRYPLENKTSRKSSPAGTLVLPETFSYFLPA